MVFVFCSSGAVSGIRGKQTTPAVASEQSIFSKNHDFNSYIEFSVNTYAPIFRGVAACGGRKLYTNRHTHTRGTATVTIIMKSTKVQTLGVICVQLYSSIIIKFAPIGSSNVDRHIDRVSVAA